MNTSEKLKELRKKAGLTQAELADKVGVSTVMMWRWESGDRFPKMENLIKIAVALNVDLWELVEGRFSTPERDENTIVTITKKEYAYLKDIERKYEIIKSIFT